MLELELDKATKKKIKDHQYYVFPKPATHTNQDHRPTEYADESKLVVYAGRGNNAAAKLHPDAVGPAELLMTALLDYGESIDDWSIKTAVIQSGYRADDASQGANYLRIIKRTVANTAAFAGKTFPANLEADAQSVLGRPGDARRTAFRNRVAQAPGWTPELMRQLFDIVDNAYAPRGSNPHATGFVFDLDFTILSGGREVQLGANTALNTDALKSAAGVWLNKYAMNFCFDSYNTGKEVWHLEYRTACTNS